MFELLKVVIETVVWLSARKNLRGEDSRPLFLKQQTIVSIVLSIVF